MKEKLQKKNYKKNNLSSVTFPNATICFDKKGFSRRRVYLKTKGKEYEVRSDCDIQIKRSTFKRNVTLKSLGTIRYVPIGDNGDFGG